MQPAIGCNLGWNQTQDKLYAEGSEAIEEAAVKQELLPGIVSELPGESRPALPSCDEARRFTSGYTPACFGNPTINIPASLCAECSVFGPCVCPGAQLRRRRQDDRREAQATDPVAGGPPDAGGSAPDQRRDGLGQAVRAVSRELPGAAAAGSVHAESGPHGEKPMSNTNPEEKFLKAEDLRRLDPKGKGDSFMSRLPIRAVQVVEPARYKNKDWPVGSWYCWERGTDRFFMMTEVDFNASYMHLLSQHS